MEKAVRFGVLMGVRHAAHNVADFWLQPHGQSQKKGAPGREGRVACVKHVATYTAVSALAVVGAGRAFGLGLSARGIVVGELVSAVTHYAADRREHGAMTRLALRMNKAGYLEAGGGPDLDQSWHKTFNAVAAGVTAVLGGRRSKG